MSNPWKNYVVIQDESYTYSEDNDDGLAFHVGRLNGDGLVTIVDHGYRTLDELYQAWPECVADVYNEGPDLDLIASAPDLAAEVEALRGLVGRQIAAMNNTPMGDMNYAGLEWLKEARAALSAKVSK